MSKRDDILERDDIKRRTIPVPEWETHITVRGMTGLERVKYFQRVQNTPEDMFAWLVVMCSEGDDGKPLFQKSDVSLVNGKSGAALQRIADVATQLSGLDDGPEERAEKNSEATTSGFGGTE